MAIIRATDKLCGDNEFCYVSGAYIFYRMIMGGGRVQFMTATAPNDDSGHVPYPETDKLLSATRAAFAERGYDEKTDCKGRPYVEVPFMQNEFDRESLEHTITEVLNGLGFLDLEVLALREMLDLHAEFAHDDEDAYLSDGTYVTSDGRLVSR